MSKNLIDRRELVAQILRKAEYGMDAYNVGRREEREAILDIISELPEVHAEKVIRCKDCKFHPMEATGGPPDIYCPQMHDDDFCSRGERKDT